MISNREDTNNTAGPDRWRQRLGPELLGLALVRDLLQTPREIQQASSALPQRDETCRTVNLITANLWHDFPRYKNITQRLEVFSRLAVEERADVLLLQEASRTPHLHVPEWIAHRLGMDFIYAPANGHPAIGFEEGLAVASRYPLSKPMLRRLGGTSQRSLVHRLALGVSVETPCGSLQVFSVHLGLAARQNFRQLRDLRTWVDEFDPEIPVLIGGDFNAAEDSPQIRHARQSWIDTYRKINPYADATTHTLRWPWGSIIKQHRLDYMFFRNGSKSWQVLDSRHISSAEMPHSDHHAVFTKVAPTHLL